MVIKSWFLQEKNTLFWHDVWSGNLPLKLQFPALYSKAKSSGKTTLAMVWNSGNVKIPLKRGLTIQMRKEKSDLLNLINNISFDQDKILCLGLWNHLVISLQDHFMSF